METKELMEVLKKLTATVCDLMPTFPECIGVQADDKL